MNLTRLLSDLGVLRTLLVGSTLALIMLAPFADGTTHVHGIKLFTSVVAPALMVILVFVLMLDIVMTRILSIDAQPVRQAGMRRAVRLELFALIALIAAWAPFLLRMFGVLPEA